MNGAQDLGGTMGHGPIDPEAMTQYNPDATWVPAEDEQ